MHLELASLIMSTNKVICGDISYQFKKEITSAGFNQMLYNSNAEANFFCPS